MFAGGSGESGSVQVIVNALLVCVCVECQSSHKQCSRSVEGSGCCLGPSLLVSELVGSRRVWCYSGNPIVMVVREICPPLVQMI